ncbi:tripartite motif-containing protein 16-like [Pseudochaenichthys georgianus]|uniref:tripartite motif-containing protein 16-like n=1 Tax=Pseudochaenichthys georgianus TaxID=52239 RepID=UPI00146F430F|nr:tripartite motif-containing protein 16-like [Pseudochaenichthys georgianus]
MYKGKDPSGSASKKRPCPLTDTGPSAGSTLCEKHRSPLENYCCNDRRLICALCAVSEHRGHSIGTVGEERRRKQRELNNMQTNSKQILQKEENKLKHMGKTLEQIQEEGRETQHYCESVLVGVIDCLQRYYMLVRELIRGQEAQAQSSLQTLEELNERDVELHRLAKTDNDVHFLQKWSSLRCLTDTDLLYPLQEVSEDPLLPFEFTKRAVEQLGEQLQDICDKEFASILHTAGGEEQQQSGGVSGVTNTEQNMEEPETRADFLQYACRLSLDRTTAHKDLTFAAGDTEVRLNSPKMNDLGLHSPDRFIHRMQVLCKEGLHADRCYYEVEVEGDKAEIALAYRGMNRKTRTRLSAFGANAFSWSLDRASKYSVSHRADSVQLTSSPSHSRIGVYLKFKEGTLAFYEVSGSDSMKFLYKLQATFTEPLYPGFWLEKGCCIRICDLPERDHRNRLR